MPILTSRGLEASRIKTETPKIIITGMVPELTQKAKTSIVVSGGMMYRVNLVITPTSKNNVFVHSPVR